MVSSGMDLDEDEQIWFAATGTGAELAHACARVRDCKIYPEINGLNRAINYLMTELWDQNFSQTEIRAAFENALADMNRYAAGHERRSDERL